MSRKLGCIVLGLWLWTVVSMAEPLVSSRVGSDTLWIGHLDVEKILAIPVVRNAVQTMMEKEPVKAKCADLWAKLGMNPLEHLKSVTMFSSAYGRKNSVILLTCSGLDSKKLVALLLEKHPQATVSKYEGNNIYHWFMGRCGRDHPISASIASDSMIVFGPDSDRVRAALDVIAGRHAGLASDSPLLKDLDDATIMFCRASAVPDAYRGSTRCPVLRHCVSAFARWQEKEGKVFAKYEFQTTSSQTATLFSQAVDGVKAMVFLRFPQPEIAGKILAGLSYKASDAVFQVSWECAIDDIKAALDALKPPSR